MPVLKFGRTLCVFGKKEIWDVITWSFKTRLLEMQVAERKRRERQVLTVLRPHDKGRNWDGVLGDVSEIQRL